ncbi:hypothetical protein OIU79_031005 [Salix purpurea]|uniref:Uncharacterized protein n=1 Tax=Salix purpurea TaxID=77065 RepID=A0A9Q0VBW4_SALPP|nr:hypothetical protein OIU79_031005 [Salix purpurea]
MFFYKKVNHALGASVCGGETPTTATKKKNIYLKENKKDNQKLLCIFSFQVSIGGIIGTRGKRRGRHFKFTYLLVLPAATHSSTIALRSSQELPFTVPNIIINV